MVDQLQLDPAIQAQLAAMGQGQLPQGQLPQPQVDAPDMSQLLADRAAAKAAAMPQTGATAPTTLSPEQYTQAQLGNLEQRKGITGEQSNIEQAGAQKEASIQAAAAADQQQRLVADQLAGQQAMADAKARDDQMMTMINKVSQEKVDPNHYWNSKTTAGKFQASIGHFLNSLGDPKLAAQQLNKAVDDDIDSQKSNIANSWKAVVETHQVADSAFNRQMHDQEWRTQYRIGALEVAKQQLAANAANTKNQMVQTNAHNAILDISKQQDDLRYQNWQIKQRQLAAQGAGQSALEKRLREQAAEASKQQVELMNSATAPMSEKDAHEIVGRMHPELVQYGLWGGGGGSMKTEAPVTIKDKEAAVVAEKDKEARTVVLPNGQTALAKDKEARSMYDERIQGIQGIKKKLDRVEGLQQKYESGDLTYAEMKEWESLNADITNTYNSTFGVKRQVGVAEGQRIEDTFLPQPPTLPSSVGIHSWANPFVKANRAKLDAVKQIVQDKEKETMVNLTPLEKPTGSAPGAKDFAALGFKPTAPRSSGGPVKPIPNIQGTNQVNTPGIPSFQQYRQGQ